MPEAVAVSRDQNQKLPQQVVEATMRTDPASLPAWIGVDLAGQGYAVVKINKLLERDAAAKNAQGQSAQQDQKQYTQWWTTAESLAYYNSLKDRFKTEIKIAKPVPKNDELVAQP